MLTLKTVLLLNGISSAITGLGLVTFVSPVATLFGQDQTAPFTYSGLFLILFGLFVVRVALSKSTGTSSLKLVSTLDILWILASITLVATNGSKLSVIGNTTIIAIASWVLLMTILQSLALRQRFAPGGA